MQRVCVGWKEMKWVCSTGCIIILVCIKNKVWTQRKTEYKGISGVMSEGIMYWKMTVGWSVKKSKLKKPAEEEN